MAREGRERKNKYSRKFIDKHKIAEVGMVACFSCPKDNSLKNLKVTYDSEYDMFMINHAPIYYSVNEVMEEILSDLR